MVTKIARRLYSNIKTNVANMFPKKTTSQNMRRPPRPRTAAPTTSNTVVQMTSSGIKPTKVRRTKRLASVHVIARRPQARLFGGVAKVA